MPGAYLVYNPTAGRYPSGLLAERAANVLRSYGWYIQLEQSESGQHITALARHAAKQDMEAFFVAGGDGSINHAVAGLVNSQTALGVLPSGTANVLAQEMGLPGLSWTRWMALEESAKRLARAPARWVDIGMCNDHPFLLWAGVGLDAFVIHRMEPRSRLEKHFAIPQYFTSVAWNARYWHGMNLRVETDGKQFDGRFIIAVVSNIHLYAGGLAQISPQACLDDGLMDLWLFKGESFIDTLQRALDLLSGNHQQSDQVEQVCFQSAHMESDSPLFLQVDGEPADIHGQLNIQVCPGALRILVPEQTPHPLFKELQNNEEDFRLST